VSASEIEGGLSGKSVLVAGTIEQDYVCAVGLADASGDSIPECHGGAGSDREVPSAFSSGSSA
jgi:hypothetical protein